MDRISGLPDEVLVKILSFVPTKVSVSTSVLSKRWEFLWMWVPKLDFVTMNHYGPDLPLRDFINKNLPLLRAPTIESFRLQCFYKTFQPEVINQWVAITLSRCIRELDISQSLGHTDNLAVLLPSSLYTCESLVSLKLDGDKILVDVPPTVSLPSLKTLVLDKVIYLNEDCLQLLLSSCPLLEDLFINNREEARFKFHDGIFFNQLQHLKLCISFVYWSKILFWLLQDSPRLRVLKLYVEYDRRFKIYKPGSWNNNQISVPECLLESLETFEFAGYSGRRDERDFVSYIIKNARRLKSSSITPPAFTIAET